MPVVLRAQNMSEEEKRAAVKDFALTKGLLVALLAGVMSACFALGLDAGTPIKEAALAGGVEGLYAGLPVIFLVTFGGFLTNAVYCLQQNVANKSMGDYAKGKVWGNNLVFCALAGVLWYMQFFGLEMGKSFLTESPVLLAFSWCILMALNVTFSNVWGNNSERMERGVKQDHNCADSWSDRPYLLFSVPKICFKKIKNGLHGLRSFFITCGKIHVIVPN